MNTTNEMNETVQQDEVPETAVSIYGQGDGALDDFPVLKAFQQYIDAEQEKARKRIQMLCIGFGLALIVIISLFVVLLIGISLRNQSLSDRLLEYALKNQNLPERSSPVVVQPAPVANDSGNAALMALTARLEEMQRRMEESQRQAERSVAEASARLLRDQEERAKIEKERALNSPAPAAQTEKKTETAEAAEIRHLKALLAAEKEKNALKKDLQRQIELEEYRRKHYPELYRANTPKKASTSGNGKDDDIDALLREVDAIRYFDDDAEAATNKSQTAEKPLPPAGQKESQAPTTTESGWTIP